MIESYKATMAKKDTALEKLQTEVNSLKFESDERGEKLAHFQAKASKWEARCQDVEAKYAACKAQLQEKITILKQCQDQLEHFEGIGKMRDDIISQLERENKDLKTRLDTLFRE